jgi:hypothetical protein
MDENRGNITGEKEVNKGQHKQREDNAVPKQGNGKFVRLLNKTI